MKITRKSFSDLAEIILEGGAVKATKYFSENLTLKATRRLCKGKIRKQGRTTEILFTIGKPNYAEREFIRKCKKSGEPFPVKKIQIKFPK